ncbi:MAG: hypothetical protein M2R45_04018 [Verrucomicrobia subdivision 3 bacterium]|nr:hypothetical protein [Limisphaerales bacterium]MCS1416231.1 hypothetical protein [Limisphaerales bacterium]
MGQSVQWRRWDIAAGIDVDGAGNAVVATTFSADGSGNDIATILYNRAGQEVWNRRKTSERQRNDAATGFDFAATCYSASDGKQFTTTETSRSRIDDMPVGTAVDSANAILIAETHIRTPLVPKSCLSRLILTESIARSQILSAASRLGDQIVPKTSR